MSLRRSSSVSRNSGLLITPYVPWLVKGIAICCALIIIPVDIILQKNLSNLEKHMIVDLQEGRSHNFNEVLKAVAYTGSHNILIFTLPVLYNFIEPTVVMKISIVSTHSLYLFSVAAIILTEPRPYWTKDSIKGISCTDGFGSPSEEVLFGCTFFIFLIIELLENKLKKQYLALVYIFTCAWVIFISFSVVFLGQNFIYQVVLSLCISYVYIIAVLAADFYLTNLSLISSYYNNKNRKAQVYWFIADMCMLCIATALHMNIDKNRSITLSWIKHAYKDCSNRSGISGYYSFYQSGWIFLNFGIVCGMQHVSKLMPIDWWQTHWIKKIVRMAVSGGTAFAISYGFESIDTSDHQTKFTFHYALNGFVCGFVAFGVLPRIFEKIRLTKRDDEIGEIVRSSFTSGVSMRNLND